MVAGRHERLCVCELFTLSTVQMSVVMFTFGCKRANTLHVCFDAALEVPDVHFAKRVSHVRVLQAIHMCVGNLD